MKKLRVLLLASAVTFPTAAAAEDLVFATAGGVWLETMVETCLKPFTEATGITVQAVATEDTAAQIRAQMMTSLQWDIVETSAETLAMGAENDWYEPLDWARIDPDNALPAVARKDYGIGFTTYTEGIAYRSDKAGDEVMTSWADFWDTKKFPGNRSLRDIPVRNLEFALMADGVPPDQVYEVLATPEGVDRAFAKLDEIKDHITVWWTAGQQPTQYLASGDVDYSSVWNGRVTSAVADGIPVAFVWDQAALIIGHYSIMKGSEKAEIANDLLKFCWTDPKIGAAVVERIPYAGFAPGLYDLLSEELARELSTYPANAEVQFAFDGDFWAARRPELQERWQRWRIGN